MRTRPSPARYYANGPTYFAIGVFFMSAMDAVAKLLAQSYSELQIILFESTFGLLFFFTFVAPRNWRSLVSPRWPLLLARGLLTLGTMYFFISGLRVLSLAEVTMIFMVAPIVSMCLSSLVFREYPRKTQLISLIVGVIGASLLIRPPGLGLNMAALFPLAAAICSAFGLITARALSRRDSPEAIAGYEYLMIFSAAALLVPYGGHIPGFASIWLVCALGVFGAMCVYFRTTACSISPISVLAPIEYTGMLWAVFFGYVIWNSLPDFWGWIGAGLITLGGVLAHRHSDQSEQGKKSKGTQRQ